MDGYPHIELTLSRSVFYIYAPIILNSRHSSVVAIHILGFHYELLQGTAASDLASGKLPSSSPGIEQFGRLVYNRCKTQFILGRTRHLPPSIRASGFGC